MAIQLTTRELSNLEDAIHRSSLRDMWRKKIERAYQRAMDIRDSTPAGPNFNEIRIQIFVCVSEGISLW